MAHIYLVGPRASGKTTIGRLLGAKMHRPFIDLDEYLSQKVGKSIERFVSQRGWQAFREQEAACLVETCAHLSGNAVIATGGGIVLAERNREFMRAHGFVFWLKTSAEIMGARLARNPVPGQRPPLTSASPDDEIRNILAEREPLYNQCAHHVVDSGLPEGDVCSQILTILDTRMRGMCS